MNSCLERRVLHIAQNNYNITYIWVIQLSSTKCPTFSPDFHFQMYNMETYLHIVILRDFVGHCTV